MTSTFDKRLGAIVNSNDAKLAGGRKGIEKESLRVDADGYLAAGPHPKTLGSALTNRFITTDFSEALLEFVTPAFTNTWEALRFLCDIHQFTYERLADELLWTASMPCRIPADREIPLARYGTSNVGRMKTIYRRGLGYRYGRHMQTIAGVHFNYSIPDEFWASYQKICVDPRTESDFRSDHYLRLVRNFRRFGWLVLYLFGASPAMCKSFSRDDTPGMPSFNQETYYEPFGTSLRMSDLGYSNKNQSRINISLNSLDEYIRDLTQAIRTPVPAYEQIGVKVDGDYRQLSANLLQIENEYYSSIRPKRVAHSGERPTAALRRGGVEYVEIRALDINIFDPAGINQNTMRFMEAFLMYCLLEDSPPIDEDALEETLRNQIATAKRGRDPAFALASAGKEISLAEWAGDVVAKVRDVASVIDAEESGNSYTAAVDEMRQRIADPDATPSARVLDELRSADCSFFDFAMTAARGHRDYFHSIASLPAERQREFEHEATASLERQHAIEAADEITLDEYIARYFASD